MRCVNRVLTFGNFYPSASYRNTDTDPGHGYGNGEAFGLDNVSGAACIPEPATMLLLGGDLVGLAGRMRKRCKQARCVTPSEATGSTGPLPVLRFG